ncbi:hypothetical protein QYF36_024490 [Acer negundo]|nr:hypothetical protein QYF36_024490 [Acer negundo]
MAISIAVSVSVTVSVFVVVTLAIVAIFSLPLRKSYFLTVSDARVNLWYDLTASDKSVNSLEGGGVGVSLFEQMMMMMSGLWNNLAIRKSPRTCCQLSYFHVIVYGFVHSWMAKASASSSVQAAAVIALSLHVLQNQGHSCGIVVCSLGKISAKLSYSFFILGSTASKDQGLKFYLIFCTDDVENHIVKMV